MDLNKVIASAEAQGRTVLAITENVICCYWKADDSYVTWIWCYAIKTEFMIGHYFSNKEEAMADFKERI